MHWKLYHEFSGMSEVDLRAHDALLDRLLHVHLQRSHLFCLSPSEVVAIRRAIQFGPQSSRVLDTILKRSQDYAASVRAAKQHVVILPMGSAHREAVGKEFYVRVEDVPAWLDSAPALYVENGVSDGRFYRFILSQAANYIGGSSNHIMIRPVHGGGNPLGSVMEELVGRAIQGVCICDRDEVRSVPPFTEGSTSFAAHEALHRMGLVDQNGLSLASNPFFKFHITEGWGVENYIGPNTLELFYDSNPGSCGGRSDTIAAFPNFPDLNEQEMMEWLSINMKSALQDADIIKRGLAQRFGLTDVSSARCAALSKVCIPGDAIRFIIAYSDAGRHHRPLISCFTKDMKLHLYRDAVVDLARSALCAFAADVRMNFA